MKHLKKIIFTAVLAAALSTSAFAASGFEFILNVPVGMGIGLGQNYTTYIKAEYGEQSTKVLGLESKPGVGFDIGVSAQIGYMFQVVNNFGISVLGEVGYSFDTFSGSYENNKNGLGLKSINYTQHSMKIGILPKFNINAFSIGIGAGFIIPFSINETMVSASGEKTSPKPIDTVFTMAGETPLGIYAKLTFDYSIFFTDKIALNIGLYTGIDILGEARINNPILGNNGMDKIYSSANLFSYDVGLQVGFRFGPKAFN